jgi:hypothetical protein
LHAVRDFQFGLTAFGRRRRIGRRRGDRSPLAWRQPPYESRGQYVSDRAGTWLRGAENLRSTPEIL